MRRSLSRLRDHGRLAYGLAVLALTLIIFALHAWPFFRPGATLGIFLDNSFTFGPIFHYLNGIISQGELPLWIKGLLGGIPFYNTPQLSFLYPFYFFWVKGMYPAPLETAFAMTWLTVAHLIVMTINMAIFLRTISLSLPAAIFGAFILSLSSCIAVYIHHVTIVSSYSWIPLLLAGFHRLNTGRRGAGSVAMMVAGASLTALATPSQTLIHAFILTAVHGVAVTIATSRTQGWKAVLGNYLAVGIAIVLTLIIVGPNLITTLLNNEEIRWLGAAGSMVGRGAVPYNAFLEDQLAVPDLLGVLIPFTSSATGNNFIGVTALACVLIAFTDARRRVFVAVYAAMGLYFLLSSTGDNLGLALINHHVPLLNMIRQPARNLYLFVFAAAFLGAVGFDALRASITDDWKPQRRPFLLWTFAAAILGLSLVALAGALKIGFTFRPTIAVALFWLVAVATFSALFYSRNPESPRVLSVGLLAALLLSWWWEQPPIRVPTLQSTDYAHFQNLRVHAALRLLAARPDRGTSKVKFITDGEVDPGDERMQFSMGALWYGVRSFNSWLNPLPNHTMFEELYDFGNKPTEFYQRLGVRYVVCTRCSGAEMSALIFVGEAAGYKVYKDEKAYPYYRVAQPMLGVGTGRSAGLAAINVLAGGDPRLSDPKYAQPPDCITSPEGATHNRLTFAINCKKPGIFVLNEVYAPEWLATNNGKAEPILRADRYQLGVLLQEGVNIVELRYYPTRYLTLLKIALVGFLVWLGMTGYAIFGALRGFSWSRTSRLPSANH